MRNFAIKFAQSYANMFAIDTKRYTDDELYEWGIGMVNFCCAALIVALILIAWLAFTEIKERKLRRLNG